MATMKKGIISERIDVSRCSHVLCRCHNGLPTPAVSFVESVVSGRCRCCTTACAAAAKAAPVIHLISSLSMGSTEVRRRVPATTARVWLLCQEGYRQKGHNMPLSQPPLLYQEWQWKSRKRATGSFSFSGRMPALAAMAATSIGTKTLKPRWLQTDANGEAVISSAFITL